MTENYDVAANRWRKRLKILVTIVVAICAIPFIIMSLIGSVQGKRS